MSIVIVYFYSMAMWQSQRHICVFFTAKDFKGILRFVKYGLSFHKMQNIILQY